MTSLHHAPLAQRAYRTYVEQHFGSGQTIQAIERHMRQLTLIEREAALDQYAVEMEHIDPSRRTKRG